MNLTPTPPSSRIDEIERIAKLLRYKKQIILQGPPGTGKTYIAKDIAQFILTDDIANEISKQATILDATPQYKLVQFHPSYTYEDFVRGIVVNSEDGTPKYQATDKTLALFAKRARENYSEAHILIIDEINRANLSSVLGELIYALEYRGQAVDSMYPIAGDAALVLPDNLYIIGTMNTADRSAGHIDYAIRRRFAFVDVLPTPLRLPEFHGELFDQVKKIFTTSDDYETPSEHLSEEFSPKDVALGHSYFISDPKVPESMSLRLEYDIKPILFEYLKDGVLKESARQKIKELSLTGSAPRITAPQKPYPELMRETGSLFLKTTNHRYRFKEFRGFQQIYLDNPVPTGLHYEYLWEPSLNQVTVDFHIESNDPRMTPVATLLKSFATHPSIIRGSETILRPNWQRKQVGYRLMVSNIEQTPEALTSAMIALINATIDKIRTAVESSLQLSTSVTQPKFF